jgi:hypothetical protein
VPKAQSVIGVAGAQTLMAAADRAPTARSRRTLGAAAPGRSRRGATSQGGDFVVAEGFGRSDPPVTIDHVAAVTELVVLDGGRLGFAFPGAEAQHPHIARVIGKPPRPQAEPGVEFGRAPHAAAAARDRNRAKTARGGDRSGSLRIGDERAHIRGDRDSGWRVGHRQHRDRRAANDREVPGSQCGAGESPARPACHHNQGGILSPRDARDSPDDPARANHGARRTPALRNWSATTSSCGQCSGEAGDTVGR